MRVEGAPGIRGTGSPINCACDLGQVTSLTRSFIRSFITRRRATSHWAPGVRNKMWPLPSGSPQASGEDDTHTDILHSMWVTRKPCWRGEGPRVLHSEIDPEAGVQTWALRCWWGALGCASHPLGAPESLGIKVAFDSRFLNLTPKWLKQ